MAWYDSTIVCVDAFLYEWNVTYQRWDAVVSTGHDDYNSVCEDNSEGEDESPCTIIEGDHAFFATVNQNGTIWWDWFVVHW